MNNPLERPTVLTKEVQEKVLYLLGEGNYLKVACEASGFTYRSFRHWQKRWEEGDPEAARFAAFFESIGAAVSAGEAKSLKVLKQGDPGWQAQAWFLERRFPQRWGRKDRVPDPPKDVKNLTDEELERLAKGPG